MPIRITTRREWGAAEPKGVPVHVEWPAGVNLWVHHTTGPATQTPREIQAFHQQSRGWNDIGYGYLIAPDGRIFEGRGYEVQAAHSPGKNHEPSVALIGDYSKIPPTDAQHRAVWALKDHLRAGPLKGHRQNTATSCPGDAAMAKIVNGPRPKPVAPPPPKKLTLRQRLLKGFLLAGFGPKSAREAADRYLEKTK